MSLLFGSVVQGQVSVNVSIGSPPPWGPVGYNQVRYYYLPDVQAYYDVQASRFIYYNEGAWIYRTSLPSRYRSYDLYHGYKVVLTDYHGNTPYTHFKEHKTKYAKGYKGQEQHNIGERPGNGHPDAKENQGQGKNTGHGQGNEKGKK